MTLFSLLLFVHLLGAVSLFIAYGIEWTASALFRDASSVEQVRSWLRVFKVSPPLSGIGLLTVLLTGGYLASLSGAMKQGWIPATLLAIFVALFLGLALILPRMKRIRAALPTANEPVSAQLRERLADPVLLTAIRVRVMVVAGILFLMACRIAFLSSLVAIAIAIALGLIFSIPSWTRTPAAVAKA